MPKSRKNKKFIVKITKSTRLSTFLKMLKSDFNKLSEDKVLDDAINILEDHLLELNLKNKNDLLLLKDEFQLDTNKLIKNSRRILNFMIYFIFSNYDKFNKCGNRYSINYFSNFDELLNILYKNDLNKNLNKQQQIKTIIIKLSKLLNDYELQIASNNLRREEKLKLNQHLIIDQMNIHESDLLEFKNLALKLDDLVGRHSELRLEASKFESVVSSAMAERLKDSVKILIDELNQLFDLFDLQSDLNSMIKKQKTKSLELKHKFEIKLIYTDLKKLENDQQQLENDQQHLENDQQELENDQQELENDQQQLKKLDKNQLKLENDQLKLENDQLKSENDQLKLENDQLKSEIDEQLEKKINENNIEKRLNELINDNNIKRLEKELELLDQQIKDKENEIDLKTKNSTELMNKKIDENALLFEHKSETFRQITESFILERKLIGDIKRLLIRMCKLIDTRFKVIYPNLNENQYFKNEIDENLNYDVILALDHFANERDARERINKKKLDDEEMKKNSINENNDLIDDQNLDKTTINDEKDNANLNLDETNCTDVKVK